MKGTRPLNNDEIRRVSNCFDRIFEARNRGLFMQCSRYVKVFLKNLEGELV